jgi:fatty acid-binding protein DegV
LVDGLKQQTGVKEIPVYELPPAIVTHGGPGAVAVGYFCEPVV